MAIRSHESLKKIVCLFILRHTKEAVAKDLPVKVEHLVRCRMTKGQARFYEKVRDYFFRALVINETAAGSANNVRFRILEGLLRLRQAAPILGSLERKMLDLASSMNLCFFS